MKMTANRSSSNLRSAKRATSAAEARTKPRLTLDFLTPKPAWANCTTRS